MYIFCVDLKRKHWLDSSSDNLAGSYQMVKGWEPLGNTSAQPAQTEDDVEGDEDGDQSRD